MREKFMFFVNFKETADKLPDEMRLKYYDAITDYVFNEKEPEDPVMAALINSIKPSLDKKINQGGAPVGNNNACKNKTTENNLKQPKTTVVSKNNLFQETETETRNGNKKQETEKYGELGYVRLTAEQYTTLKEKYPNLDEAIEVLDTWLGTNGSKHRNKNHYAYFKSNSWVWERVAESKKNADIQGTAEFERKRAEFLKQIGMER